MAMSKMTIFRYFLGCSGRQEAVFLKRRNAAMSAVNLSSTRNKEGPAPVMTATQNAR